MDTPRDATKLRTTAPWAPSQQSLLLTLPIEILLTICEDDDLGFFDRVAFVGTCRSIREACGGAAFRDLTLTTKPDVFGQESRFQPPLKWHAAVLEKGRWNECVRYVFDIGFLVLHKTINIPFRRWIHAYLGTIVLFGTKMSDI